VYITAEAKWTAIVLTLQGLHEQGRPVLVGTRSVAASEHLSELLTQACLPHQVLNARQDQEEAEVIARAGERGRITVATNMAGRGTDIRIRADVAELGGLYVLATERHFTRRIDRQLFGRGGRQGDPGSFQAIVSLEDELVHQVFGDHIKRLATTIWDPSKSIPLWAGEIILWIAQYFSERHNVRARRDLLKVDDHLSDLLAFSGRSE
jgi:preprotein translocase subunit SecA